MWWWSSSAILNIATPDYRNSIKESNSAVEANKSLRVTHAMEAWITDHIWDLSELLV